MARSRKRAGRCFVVISHEGCYLENCTTPHILVECEYHGTLAKVEKEDTAAFIMGAHLERPAWPKPIAPLNEQAIARIAEAKVKRDTIYVPSSYKGGA